MDPADDPAEVLGPYKSFRLTDLRPALEAIIEEGWTKKDRKSFPIDDRAWGDLWRIMAVYLRGHKDIEGFLSMEQRTDLLKIGGRAAKVLRDIGEADASGLRWAVINELKHAGFSDQKIESAISVLDFLSKMDPRTPYADREILAKENLRPSDHAASILDYEPLRPALQAGVDAWWDKHTGLPKDFDEEPGPFEQFLTEFFGRVKLSDAPGSSETAVKKARRQMREKAQRNAALHQQLAEAMAHLKAPAAGRTKPTGRSDDEA